MKTKLILLVFLSSLIGCTENFNCENGPSSQTEKEYCQTACMDENNQPKENRAKSLSCSYYDLRRTHIPRKPIVQIDSDTGRF